MAAFFALAFGWTWLLQALVISERLPALFDLPLLALAGVGPSLAALLLDRGAVVASLRRPLVPALLAVAVVVPVVLRLAVRALSPEHAAGEAIGVVALGSMVLPPVGEELGWRGLALPRLSQRIGALPAALLVSAAWALWHLPTALFPGARLSGFPAYALAVFAGGLFIAWAQRRGGGSVVIAVAAHAAMNGAALLLPIGEAPRARAMATALWLVVAVLCAASLRRRSG